MKKTWIPLATAAVLLSGCLPVNIFEDNTPLTDENTKSGSDLEVVADNLTIPWSIEEHEGTFYISERPGSIAKVEGGTVEQQTVSLELTLSEAAEAGLLGFVLAPDFGESNEAFAYYTYEQDGNQFNRIVKLELESDAWTETEVLLDEIPSGNVHHGGRLEIGPDDKLYATAGDASDPDLAQDEASLAGKILRLNLDGSIPEDNPFGDSYVYSMGHRNAQGLTWSEDGELYASEHGPSANDEVNQIVAGANYGWPTIEGTEEQEGLESPLFASGSDRTWAPSGMAYRDGKVYVAALRGTTVLEFDLATEEYRAIVEDVGRVRDVWIDGDNLYFVSNNTDGRGNPSDNDDKLYKLTLE